jgi:hypothetical protein
MILRGEIHVFENKTKCDVKQELINLKNNPSLPLNLIVSQSEKQFLSHFDSFVIAKNCDNPI